MTDTQPLKSRWVDMVFGGIWLLFLASPIIALVISDAPLVWRILGWAATALFAIGYLLSYLHPTPGPLGTFAGAAAWTSILSVLVALTIPAVGPYAVTFVPFLMAIGVFRLPTPWDLLSAIAPALALITTLLLLGDASHLSWQIPITLVPLIVMVPLRRVSDVLDRQGRLREELALSCQREQVGRDVHDILGHSLTVIAVKTELAHKLVARDPDRARAELADVLDLTHSALGEVRTTVTQLQKPSLTSQLAAAQTALDAAGIRVERPAHVADLDDAHSRLLAWCLREAVTNVVRHSGADRCEIAITDTGLTVTDDGAGLGVAAEGHGLRGMRQRIADAGGAMVLTEARPGTFRPGTRVGVTL